MITAALILAIAPMTNFYIGTYTAPNGAQGIYRATLNGETGAISDPVLAIAAEQPSFVAVCPNHKFLYAVHETDAGETSAYAIQPDKSLKLLNTKPASGAYVCHVSVDPAGKNVFTSSYGGGPLRCYPVLADGSLGDPSFTFQNSGTGPDASRQESTHMHAAYVDAKSRFVYACDLGTDEVLRFKFTPDSHKLELAEPRSAKAIPGGGPRHLALSADGKFAYVCNEMKSSVTTFSIAADGHMSPLQTISTLAAPVAGNSNAEIFLHPNGKWLYASNRGHDSLAVYAVGHDGQLTLVEIAPVGVKTPRGFAIDPTGKWIVVGGQDINQITALKIDSATGKLAGTGQKQSVGKPVCIVFVPY